MSGGGSHSNFLWILKSSFFYNTSKKLFNSFAGHISNSASLQSLSGKLNRCEYEQLTPDEDNNNRPVDAKKNGKNKTQHHRRFGSIDDDNDRDSQDDSDRDDDDDDDDDDDEEIDRLTCWVCERAFSSTRILERHKIRERHFGCGTCDAIFPTLMALEAHQEEVDHWSSDDEDDDEDDEDLELDDHDMSDDDSQLDTEDEMELERKDRKLKKERLFLI